MGASEKAEAAFHPDDEHDTVLMGENPGLPPMMQRAWASASPNGRSAATAVLDAAKVFDAAAEHAANLQAAINEIRALTETEYTAYPLLVIRNILERHGV